MSLWRVKGRALAGAGAAPREQDALCPETHPGEHRERSVSLLKGIKQMLMGLALIGVAILLSDILSFYAWIPGLFGLGLAFVGFYFTDD